MRPSSWPLGLQWMVLATLYVAAAKLGLSVAFLNGSVSPVWPPTGIALAALLLLGTRVWPGVWLGAFIANATTAVSPVTALEISIGNLLEAWVGSRLLLRFVGASAIIHQVRGVFLFGLLEAAATAIAATVGVLALIGSGAAAPAGWHGLWLTWWLGDLMGAITLTPLLLSWFTQPRVRPRGAAAWQLMLFNLLVLVVSWVVFAGVLPTRGYPVAYITLPLFVMGSYYFGSRGGITAVLIAAAVAIWGTLQESGYAAVYDTNTALLLLQGYMAVSMLLALLVAVVDAERQEAAEKLAAALKELSVSEAIFRELLKSAPEAIIVGAEQDLIFFMNARTERIFGFERSELLGKPLESLICERDREVFRRAKEHYLARSAGAALQVPVELCAQHRDGSQVSVELSFSTAFVESMRFVIALMHDVSRQKAEQARLRASETWLMGALESVPDAVVIVDEQGRIAFVNSQSEQRFGYRRQDLLGKPVEMLIPESYHDVHRRHRADYMAHPVTRPIGIGLQLFALRRDGSRIPVEISLSPLPTPQGMLVTAIVRDVSWKTAGAQVGQTELSQIQRFQEAFFSTMSHELRTPLTLISGYAELLKDKYPQDVLLDGIEDGSHRLAEHFNKIFDYNALLSGTLQLSLTVVDLAEILEGIRMRVEESPEFRRKGLTLSIQVEPDLPVICADMGRLIKVFMHLLDNAIRLMPSGGSLGITASRADGRIRIEVWDTGPGIPTEQLAHLWDEGAQRSLEPGFGGLGLGLLIVKWLVELHHGTIEVASQEGHGSRFTLYLPI